MKILAIETSCDETSAALLESSRGKIKIVSSIVSSQINIHKNFGGVVPEVAARCHSENILPVLQECLKKTKPKEVDLIAVTAGPGLITSLIVGVEAAKALSFAWKKPLMAVNHMYGHMAANFLEKVQFPAVCLIVSGGHTEIIFLKNYLQFVKVGQTVDDAAGEAFDKVAKLLNLGYPGGPIVSKMASAGNPRFSLPRPMLKEDNFNFSFSGLKTAVLYQAQKLDLKKEKNVVDMCASFEEAAVEVLTVKTIKAARKLKAKTVMMAGGVAANRKLREILKKETEKTGRKFLVPEFSLCTDNAAMIAIAASFLKKKSDWKKIQADPNWELK